VQNQNGLRRGRRDVARLSGDDIEYARDGAFGGAQATRPP
jgi:hypothetical protein